jgi:hypothetical protein
MKIMMLAAMLGVSLCSNATLYAQEKPKPEEKAGTVVTPLKTNAPKDVTPLRVQVVLAEYEGEKKLSNLPYTLLVNARDGSQGPVARIRMGLRVPIATGNSQFQYQEVGTNLDSWASKEQDGRFNLHLSVERSSAYSPSEGQKQAFGVNEISSGHPVIQQFRSEFDLLIRDGQTTQSTMATDPVSGRVTKAEVTVNVLK